MRSSDEVIIASPMSVSGFTRRFVRSTKTSGLKIIPMFVIRVIVLVVAIAFLLVWNVLAWTIFGWWTLIWRRFRNQARRDTRQQLQHQEMLEATRH